MSQPQLSPSEEWVHLTDELVRGFLDEAISLKLNLSGDEEVYDLQYIGDRLAQCSMCMEKLSEIQLGLTRISLEVIKKSSAAEAYVRRLEERLRGSLEYDELPRDKKAAWLQDKLNVARDNSGSFSYLRRVVSEVRGAVADKIQMFRRLDSDVRLHQKLLEAKVAVGATGGARSAAGQLAFKPSPSVGDLDLD